MNLSDTKQNLFLSKMQKWIKRVFKVSLSNPQGIAVLKAQLLCRISLKGITTLCEGAIYNLLCASSAETKDRTTSILAFPHLSLLNSTFCTSPGNKGSGDQGARFFMSVGSFDCMIVFWFCIIHILSSRKIICLSCTHTHCLSMWSLSRGNKDLTME